ncbi:MAG TPA: HAD-IB family hydrolase [Actinocatenispora sp.]
MGRAAAFFDLDRTVIATSSALAFARPFYRDGLMNRRDVLASGYAQLVYKLAGAGDEQMAKIRDQLASLCRGWRVDQVRRIVAETLDELIAPYVYAEAVALIGQHRAAGRDVVLVSSSGEEMVRPIADLVGAGDVIATRMTVRDGLYTGDVEFYAAGPNKAQAVREMAARNGYDLAACYAYSDSVSDLPLLETVGYPTVVNPDRALRRAAQRRAWPLMTFRRPVPTRLVRLASALRRPAPGSLLARPGVPAALAVTAGAAVVCAIWYGRRRAATRTAS